MAPGAEAAASSEDADALLLEAYPELRPLRGASRGQALRRLRVESRSLSRADLRLGELELELETPSRLRLKGLGGRATTLNGVSGSLSLPVLPPFHLDIEPPPPADRVRWRGRVLAAEAANPGRFRYPPAAATAPAAGARPQRAAIAP